METDIVYYCYPRTQHPPPLAEDVAQAFQAHEAELSTIELSQDDSLKSDDVLETVRPELEEIGFEVETGKGAGERVYQPATFRENGEHDHSYEVDGYHEGENCVIEIDAGRAWDSNHTHRNLIRAMTMAEVDLLVMAVPRKYKHSNGTTPAFEKSKEIVDLLYRTKRIEIPFRLILLGY